MLRIALDGLLIPRQSFFKLLLIPIGLSELEVEVGLLGLVLLDQRAQPLDTGVEVGALRDLGDV